MANKGGSKHQTRIALPVSVHAARKKGKWIYKTRAGPHEKDASMPLGFVVRDVLGLAQNQRETRRILKDGLVHVDQQARSSENFPVGLFDYVDIVKENKRYIVVMDTHGRLKLKDLPLTKKTEKLCWVKKKSLAKGKKMRVTLHDGRNLMMDQTDLKIGDSVMIDLSSQKITQELRFGEGMTAFIISGKHCGELAKIKHVIPGTITRSTLVEMENTDGESFQTLHEYAVIVGEKKPVIEIQ